MDELCLLGWVGILVIIGCMAFIVLGIPLFYTLITRWLTADGAPVIDRQDFAPAAAPVAPAPVAAAAAVEPEPAKVAEVEVAGERDDLKVLPGLLVETEAKLNAAGVRRYADLASLGAADIERLGNQLSLRNTATWAAWKRGAAQLLRDDLKVLPGLLAETEAKLNAAGVASFEKMASLSDAEVGRIGDLISFRNRATWNAWRAKAAELKG